MRALPALAIILAVFLSPPAPRAADDTAPLWFMSYSVSDRAARVVSAVTPYDDSPAARNAFLRWFKRGFDTILTGRQPLMVEWNTAPEAKAGRRGYDFGMDEAKRYLEKPGPRQPLQTIPIPPGES